MVDLSTTNKEAFCDEVDGMVEHGMYIDDAVEYLVGSYNVTLEEGITLYKESVL